MYSSTRFRENVRAAMSDAGISQAALAETLGTSQAHISKILSGQTQPSLELADRIADGVGVELALLVGQRSPAAIAG